MSTKSCLGSRCQLRVSTAKSFTSSYTMSSCLVRLTLGPRESKLTSDGNPNMNLASFVHTWVPDESQKLMEENLNKVCKDDNTAARALLTCRTWSTKMNTQRQRTFTIAPSA